MYGKFAPCPRDFESTPPSRPDPFFQFNFDAANVSELGQRWGVRRHWSKTYRRGHQTPLEKQSQTQQRQIRNDTLSLALCASKRKMRSFCSPLQKRRTRHTRIHTLSLSHTSPFSPGNGTGEGGKVGQSPPIWDREEPCLISWQPVSPAWSGAGGRPSPPHITPPSTGQTHEYNRWQWRGAPAALSRGHV